MKQVPTNVTMHSVSSLSNADLSIYDSVDDQVLSDYAVRSHFVISKITLTKKGVQHDRPDLRPHQGELCRRARCTYGFYGRRLQERRWHDQQAEPVIQSHASSCMLFKFTQNKTLRNTLFRSSPPSCPRSSPVWSPSSKANASIPMYLCGCCRNKKLYLLKHTSPENTPSLSVSILISLNFVCL